MAYIFLIAAFSRRGITMILQTGRHLRRISKPGGKTSEIVQRFGICTKLSGRRCGGSCIRFQSRGPSLGDIKRGGSSEGQLLGKVGLQALGAHIRPIVKPIGFQHCLCALHHLQAKVSIGKVGQLRRTPVMSQQRHGYCRSAGSNNLVLPRSLAVTCQLMHRAQFGAVLGKFLSGECVDLLRRHLTLTQNCKRAICLDRQHGG